MTEKDLLLEKLENILALLPTEQKELVYLNKDYQLTRFANNYIHQNIAEKDLQLTIKLVEGKKVAIGTINSLEEETVKFACKKLQDNIRYLPDDPFFDSLPLPEPLPLLDTYDQWTAETTPLERAEMIKIVTSHSEKFKLSSSGHCTTSFSEFAVLNSNGVRAYNSSTEANFLAFVMADLEGFSSMTSRKIEKIDVTKIAEESVGKCWQKLKPIELPAGVYTVIMEPYAVAELLANLCLENFNGEAYLEKRSCISGKLGQKITGSLINVFNDPFDPKGLFMPFDFEGLPRKKVTFIENGVAREVTHNSYTAAQANTFSTGNRESPSLKTPYPLNVSMKEGNYSIEEMIASVDYGIYITKLNYLSIIDPKNTVNTGLTRGGTFLIKKGKLANPVYNLRFTESILGALAEVSMISTERKLFSEHFFNTVAPALKIDKFRFTGTTKSSI